MMQASKPSPLTNGLQSWQKRSLHRLASELWGLREAKACHKQGVLFEGAEGQREAK